MNFNLLPNELLLAFFEYLYGDDLLHAFYGLNARINALLYKQHRCYFFKYSSLPKCSLNLICQKHIPMIADRILALHLSYFEPTPGLTNLFFSYIPSLRQFTHLRLLSLFYLSSKEILLKIAIELPHLVQLTHLKLSTCLFSKYDETDFELLTNNIWNLPNLTHCYFDLYKTSQQSFITLSKISSSVTYLSINPETLNFNSINRLFQYTPNLKYFQGHIHSFDHDDDYIRSSFSSLTNLNIFITADSSKIISFLRNTPNLHCLKIIMECCNFIDGYQWEDLIRNHLPKLRTFHLSMGNLSIIRPMTEEQIDEFMNSFRSSFWIDEHRWFFRCMCDKLLIHFETVSNAFYYINNKFPGMFKSTDSQDKTERLHTSMSSFLDVTRFNQSISSKIYFSKLCSVLVKFPINDQYWSMISNLHQVSSLLLDFSTNFSQSEFQALLNRMPDLRSLTIHQDASLPLPMSLFNCTSSSIHYLYLQYCKHYFNEEDSIILSHSSLTSQCKYLDILVKNRESITIIVNNITNLYALRARFTDEEIYELTPSRICNNVDDEDIQWLIDHLPSTCTISRDPSCINDIQIWIK